MKRACYFGIYDPKHWRTRSIRLALERRGYEVVECRVDPREHRGWGKYRVLYNMLRELHGKYDFIIVGFPGYIPAIVAGLASSKPIIFDAYISYVDGIRDRRNYPIWHPAVWVAWVVDVLSGFSADVVLTINYAYKSFFVRTLLMPERKVEVLHKGADERIFYPRPKAAAPDTLKVGWWGSFIPLHGVPVIVDAANIVKDCSGIEFHLIGRGQLLRQVERRVYELGLSNISVTSDFVPEQKFGELVSGFDIALGIFAPTPKSGRCVTNKVYEAMAMGKPIITQDSSANREIFTHGENAYLVPAGDAHALAQAVRELASNEALRSKLGSGARALFESKFTEAHIEEELFDIIERHHVA